jgi:hypothetical protein
MELLHWLIAAGGILRAKAPAKLTDFLTHQLRASGQALLYMRPL